MAKLKNIIKTLVGDIERDDKNFWSSKYDEYLILGSTVKLSKELGMDIRMLSSIFKEHGFLILKSAESRTGKLKKDFIESTSGIKYMLLDTSFWDGVYNMYTTQNYSETRLSEYLEISRKQLRRAFTFHKYAPKTGDQVKNTVVESSSIKYGSGIPSKSMEVREKIRNSHLARVILDTSPRFNSEEYEILDDYTGTRVQEGGIVQSYKIYNFKHRRCGGVFQDSLDRKIRCPICYANISVPEKDYSYFIDELGFNTEKYRLHHDNGDTSKFKEIDILISKLNIGFEYNSNTYHSGQFMDSGYHKNKTEVCLANNIQLYHIWEYMDKDIVKSRIRNILGLNNLRVYARNLEVREVPVEDQKSFYKYNHLYGYCPSTFTLGLYSSGDSLISSMSFVVKGDSIELVRYCNMRDTSIVGGFSKLLKNSIKYIKVNRINVKVITTFGYRDWCPNYEDSVYYKNGFKFICYNVGSLRYLNSRNNHVSNRQKYMKYKLEKLFPETFDPLLTEQQILALNKIFPLHDSGTIKFTLDIY